MKHSLLLIIVIIFAIRVRNNTLNVLNARLKLRNCNSIGFSEAEKKDVTVNLPGFTQSQKKQR